MTLGYVQADESLQVTTQNYIEQINQWRTDHETRFRSPTGWLALTGHYWLADGENRIGTDETCAVQLPVEAAGQLKAKITVRGSRVVLKVSSGGPLLADGQPVTDIELPIDMAVAESDCAVKLEVGERLRLQLVRRVGRLAVRVRDSQSELIRKFQGKTWFGVDAKYRVPAKVVPLAKPQPLKITNIKGDETVALIAGTLEFEWEGQTYKLDAVQESSHSLFVTFKDRTNGKDTYAAGRFVDVDLPADSSQQVVIDFNKAYSPPCAWSPHTLCPLPPKQNHLPLAIEAGERMRTP